MRELFNPSAGDGIQGVFECGGGCYVGAEPGPGQVLVPHHDPVTCPVPVAFKGLKSRRNYCWELQGASQWPPIRHQP